MPTEYEYDRECDKIDEYLNRKENKIKRCKICNKKSYGNLCRDCYNKLRRRIC